MLKWVTCAATLLVVGWTIATPSRAGLITNGSFEEGSFVADGNGAMSLNPGSTVITGWTVVSAELVWTDNNNSFGIVASDGDKSLDLTGYHDASPYGGVEQTISTVVGESYHLEFDLGVNPVYGSSASLTATAGGTSSLFTYTAPPGTGGQQWQRYSLDFHATSTSTLISLVGASPSGKHIALDNVTVTGRSAAVPEPSSLALVGSGFIGLLCFGRRVLRVNRRATSV